MPDYSRIAKGYDLIDVLYFTPEGNNPRAKIAELIPDENLRVLDLCCGTMGNSIPLAKKRRRIRLTGLDLSPEMLAVAREKIRENGLENVETLVGDASHTNFEGSSFDYIILGLVLHEIEEILAEKILREAYRLLRPEGKLLVLEWERPGSFLKRLRFFPNKISEPRPFRAFYKMDKVKYFRRNHFSTVRQFHCDYSCVFELEKAPA